jgi:hypothetical protein
MRLQYMPRCVRLRGARDHYGGVPTNVSSPQQTSNGVARFAAVLVGPTSTHASGMDRGRAAASADTFGPSPELQLAGHNGVEHLGPGSGLHLANGLPA